MPTITAPEGRLSWSGSAGLSSALVAATGTEVWVTEVGGARLVQVPTDAILGLSWTESLDGPVTVQFTVERYRRLGDDSWLVDWLRPMRPEAPVWEVQVVHEGRVVCWGPVVGWDRTIGDAALGVRVVDFDWLFGFRLIPGVDPRWGREWLVNPAFSNGLDGWLVEWPNPVVADEILRPNGGRVVQTVHFPFDGDWRVRWTARVWVDSSVPDGHVFASMTAPGRVGGPQVTREVRASTVNRDQWQTVVVEFDLRNTASLTGRKAQFRFDADGLGFDDVQVDETSVQVSADSFRVDTSDVRVRHMLTQQQALFEVVHACGEQLAVAPAADGVGDRIETPWRARRDVYASEALRQITDVGGAEIEPLRTLSTRLLVLRVPVRGREWGPEDLTWRLTADGTGNVITSESWSTGVDRPTNEWTVLGESGFTGVYQSMDRYGGLLLQTLDAAPTGTGDSNLPAAAREKARGARDETDTWRLLVPRSHGVRVGDRVPLVIDDGPDQWDGLVRVAAVTTDPAVSWVAVDARRWDGG